jgi:hypothetical protein
MFYISFDAEQLWVLNSVPGEVKTDNSDGEIERVLQTLSSLPSPLPSRKYCLFCFPLMKLRPSFLQD